MGWKNPPNRLARRPNVPVEDITPSSSLAKPGLYSGRPYPARTMPVKRGCFAPAACQNPPRHNDDTGETMGFLAGKRFLITGVLSNRSIAYGIARACHREGAELAFSYVGERFKDRVSEFAAEFGSKLVYDCDVANDAQIDAM